MIILYYYLICSKLKFDYVDLYLIHWPLRIKKSGDVYNLRAEDLLHFDVKGVWEAMEECYKLGLAKSIGVSNFSSAKLSKILEFATVRPSVNQVCRIRLSFLLTSTIVLSDRTIIFI